MTGLAELVADRDIRHGLALFARIIDAREWERLPEVFASDLSFNYGGGEEDGIEALCATMRRFLDRCGPTQHLIGSIIIDVEADTATSRAYVQARHQRRDNPAGPIFDSNGEYVDRWALRAAGWRIVRRDALWATHHGDPAILAAATGDLG